MAQRGTESQDMEKIVSLAKRRGFLFPGSEIYGGLAGTWDYGPLGVELVEAVKRAWWSRFVSSRSDMFGLKTAILMNSKVWEATGHVKHFSDPMVDCRNCKGRFRADHIDLQAACPTCGKTGTFTEARMFNMMFGTHAGPVADDTSAVYLRPETAQGMFVNFKNVLDTMRPKLPFGIAQIGKAFRNEITPGNFVFRMREFEQMEVEYFVRPDEWEAAFEAWAGGIRQFARELGLSSVHDVEIPDGDRAFYSKRTIDFHFDYPFGRDELWAIAYRTDYDLKRHMDFSGIDLRFREEGSEPFIPHVIEPTFGVDRTILAILVSAYKEDGERKLLSLKPQLAPYQAAVFPLLANKPQLVEKARTIYEMVKDGGLRTAWDDRGNIGKRYYAQDEIGTPWCITVDFETLEDGTVTVRDRDSAKQERVAAEELKNYFQEKLKQ